MCARILSSGNRELANIKLQWTTFALLAGAALFGVHIQRQVHGIVIALLTLAVH